MEASREAEVLRSNIVFIQQSIVAAGLPIVAGYLLQFRLIPRANYDDVIHPCGRGPVLLAAMLLGTVELKISSDPNLFFPKFTEALRLSNLGNVADKLEKQVLPEHECTRKF